MKYKNSPYYKGALLWDKLSISARNSISMLDFEKHLKSTYQAFDNCIE